MEDYRRLAPDLEHSVLIAQYRMLASYMPLMYILNIVCTLLLAALISDLAPPNQVFPILTALLFVAVIRLSYWLNPRLPETETPQSIKNTVARAPFYGFAYFALLTYWTFEVASYGTESHLLIGCFFVALASSCAVSFNAHQPRSVYAVLLGGALPMTAYLAWHGTENSIVFATIFAAIIIVQAVSVLKQHDNFVAAIHLKLVAEANREEAELARRNISRLANTDPLTGLPNRRALIDVITNRIAGAPAHTPFALGLIDLDGFKPVNDLHGHAAGDEVLVTVAKRLKLALGPDTFVARLGGDEFGFIITDPPERTTMLHGLSKLAVDAISEPIPVDEVRVHISACCGVARCPESATDSNDLLHSADDALYAAKRLGRGSVTIFNIELEQRQTRRLLVETRLRKAISEQSLELAFQPITDLTTCKIICYEALARWRDAVLGPVSPAEFIPLAEQTGLVASLSEVLFEQALMEAGSWPSHILLSFNLSPVQIHDPHFALRTLATLSRHQFPPSRLTMEVTETALLTDLPRAISIIDQLRNSGINIALDDFGVGYAGFGYLDRLTFDKLKIDRSFVQGMTESKRKRQIVKSIVEMCHSLDITCVAEGIEKDDELQLLKAIGCDAGQGFLIGRPAEPPSLGFKHLDVRTASKRAHQNP